MEWWCGEEKKLCVFFSVDLVETQRLDVGNFFTLGHISLYNFFLYSLNF